MSSRSLTTTLPLNNGTNMVQFGLGTWRSDVKQVEAAVYHAITKCGIRHIDCAAVYQNEDEVGIAINKAITEGHVKREDLYIVSKLWNTEHDPTLVEAACRQTLKDLQLEYVDLYLIHWPISFPSGRGLFPMVEGTQNFELIDLNLRETWKAMESLVELGLAKSIGVSNFTIQEMEDISVGAKIPIAVNQVELQPYWNQKELREYCQKKGIVITSYSPLGNLNPSDPDAITPLKDNVVIELAKKYNKSPAQLLIRWNLQVGNVCIPKTVSLTRLEENSNIFDFNISDEDMQTLNNLGEGATKKRLVNPPFRKDGAPTFTD